MPTRTPTTALTIGFFGTGVMDVEQGTTIIEEFIDSKVTQDEKVRWIFVLTSDEFTQTLAELAATAKEFGIAYEVITQTDDKARRTFQEVASTAAHIHNVGNPLLQMEQILKEASQSALFMLWDDERTEEMERVSSQFLDDEIKVYELSDALTPLDWDADDNAEATVTAIRPERCGAGHSAPRANRPGKTDSWTCDLPLDHTGDHKALKSDGTSSRTWSDDEDEAEAEEEEADTGEIYSRTDLKEMSMIRLKEVAATLGLPPRKKREDMVSAILATQSGAEAEEAEEAEEAIAETYGAVPDFTVVDEQQTAVVDVTSIGEVLDLFTNTFVARMSDVFDGFLTDLGKTVEGIQFNLTPEEPSVVVVDVATVVEEPEQPRRRRLSRS